MKTTIKNILNNIKKHNYERIIIELILFTMLFNTNNIIGVTFLLIIIFEILLSKDVKNILFIFIFLSFFDEKIKIEQLEGSISRIIILFILLKLSIQIIKNRIKPNKFQIGVIVFFTISCIVGIIEKNINMEVFITIFNIFLFICFSMTLNLKNNEEIEKFIEKLCYTILIAVFCASIYGLVTANFLKDVRGDSVAYRFNGTYEPNFMCMYLNLAILALFTIKNKVNKILYYILSAILINFEILTVSIAGIGALVISIIVYFILYKKEWKELLKNLLIIFLISIIIFLGIKIITIERIIEYINFKNKNNLETTYEITNGDLNIENNVSNIENNVSNIENLYGNINNESQVNNQIIYNDETGIHARIRRIINQLENGKIDDLTSGRTALVRTFFKASFNRPILEVLFGNNPINKKVYCDFFDRECFSHNSYMDCLYNFGIVGFGIIIGFLLYRTTKNVYVNTNITNCKYSKNIKVIRIMLLMCAVALTLYTKRMFLVLFLI